MSGHSPNVPSSAATAALPHPAAPMRSAVAREPASEPASEPSPARSEEASTCTFEGVYDTYFPFVWRSVRRLGVPERAVDDVVQDIFVVVHRRLGDFEGRSSVKTWLFGIVLRTVRDHRRTLRRKPGQLGAPQCDGTDGDMERLTTSNDDGPHESAARAQAVRLLHAVLDTLDDEKREVFVLAELEQMAVPEIAKAIDVNANTVYARLRAARHAFDEALARHHARDGWRLK